MSEAVDNYLYANLEACAAARLWLAHRAWWLFISAMSCKRRDAAVTRIQRLLERAEQAGIVIFFENHNREPETRRNPLHPA